MLTGLYLSQHRIENNRAQRRFNDAIVTLPQALARAGLPYGRVFAEFLVWS